MCVCVCVCVYTLLSYAALDQHLADHEGCMWSRHNDNNNYIIIAWFHKPSMNVRKYMYSGVAA